MDYSRHWLTASADNGVRDYVTTGTYASVQFSYVAVYVSICTCQRLLCVCVRC